MEATIIIMDKYFDKLIVIRSIPRIYQMHLIYLNKSVLQLVILATKKT